MDDSSNGRPPHVAVIGGGISGLAAALELSAGGDVRVTVLEGSTAVGGKLRTSEVAGVPVDEGAEWMLARRPEGLELAAAAGLGDALVTPRTTTATIWSRGALREMPSGHVMGVPADLTALAASGLLTPAELARVPLDVWLPRSRLDGFTTVGGFVGGRLGRAVVDRLVDPLLSGVYAGSSDGLSMEAVLPQLAGPLRTERSLLAAAQSVRAAQADRSQEGDRPGSPFRSLSGGLGRLPGALAELVTRNGTDVRTGATVRKLARTASGWRLTVGSASSPEVLDADAVVVALPAAPAARLLHDTVPYAAVDLADIPYAGVALVTVALRRADIDLPDGSGFLVPAVEDRLVKAATFATQKWGWYAELDPDLVVVRLSIGRYGDERVLQRDDEDLVDAALADLTDFVPRLQGRPVDTRVSRWGGSLPQYVPGHLARVNRIRTAVASTPGLAVCGAAYDGVGIPACAASGTEAAAQVRAALGSAGE